MLNPHQLVNLILEPALMATGMYSLDAMYLMICTALVESKLTHLKQLPNGPALGLFQIEPATYLDIKRYLSKRTDIRSRILNHCERTYLPDNPLTIIGDITLSILLARVKYWMIPESIPSYKDPEAQALYYKKYYNTNHEINTIPEFVNHSKNITGWISHEVETTI